MFCAAIRNHKRTPAKSKVQIRWFWFWWWWWCWWSHSSRILLSDIMELLLIHYLRLSHNIFYSVDHEIIKKLPVWELWFIFVWALEIVWESCCSLHCVILMTWSYLDQILLLFCPPVLLDNNNSRTRPSWFSSIKVSPEDMKYSLLYWRFKESHVQIHLKWWKVNVWHEELRHKYVLCYTLQIIYSQLAGGPSNCPSIINLLS